MPRPDFVRVDAFLADAISTRALATAFELGIIDRLVASDAAQALPGRVDAAGAALLLGALRASGVLAPGADLRLSAAFCEALRYRDLLEAKLAMLDLVGPDFLELFTALIVDPARFQRSARLFELFSYDRAHEPTPENLAHVSRWVRFTSALTRYEAPVLLDAADLSACQHLLDVGGNSGEFAAQACDRHPALRATVLDLPVVCHLGERHVARLPASARIDFVRAGESDTPFPGVPDAIVFKSMLHDWPDAQALGFLRRARAALAPGGRLWILERAAPVEEGAFEWGALPVTLFFRSYRRAGDYRALLDAAGFGTMCFSQVELDMPFHVIEAGA
jgi:SAM-dependent methyltransferase